MPPPRPTYPKRTKLAVLGPQQWGQNVMLISEDYRQLAERCMRLAEECSEPLVAEALRVLALDYLVRAGSPASLRPAYSWE
jgi:hypothetical protein